MCFKIYASDWKDIVYRDIDELDAWIASIDVQTIVEACVKKAYCEVCGSTDERELHHVAGRKHDYRTITICKKCHRLLSDEQKTWDKRWERAGQSEKVRQAFLLQGLRDILRLRARTTGNYLCDVLASRYTEEISKRLREG